MISKPTLYTSNGQYTWNNLNNSYNYSEHPSINTYNNDDEYNFYAHINEDICKTLAKQLTEKEEYEMKNYRYPVIEKVIVNGPATIVYFNDKDRVIVKKMGVDKDDLFSAVAQAYCKKVFGSTSAFHREVMNKLVVQEPKKAKKKNED